MVEWLIFGTLPGRLLCSALEREGYQIVPSDWVGDVVVYPAVVDRVDYVDNPDPSVEFLIGQLRDLYQVQGEGG